ncbi:MAG TPA: tannase/feruloyl esterase family alpha/beta hydrolase [Caulobacteraceae bacterium]|jgi:hypothetical protein
MQDVKEQPKLDVASYAVRDRYFGKPYIDRDEHRDAPYPHRNVHGGFENTDTRFTFYFPAKEEWGGRMYHPLEGAHAGHEEAFAGAMGALLGGLEMMTKLGGYMVESNSGHIGDDIDPRAGVDPGLYGYRASVESARFSKHVAKQVYGREPDYSYVWGGSGGGRRSPLCLEYCDGVYDGALPFMGGGNIETHGTNSRVRSEQPLSFGSMFNVQRLLEGDKLDVVIDAMQPGGSGNPFEGLTTHEREELSNLYRLGYPRGDELMISKPMGQIWLWSSIADMLLEEDADYFKAFWTRPGYVGHDQPEAVQGDLIDVTLPVTRIITAQELMSEEFAGPEYADAKPMAMMIASSSGQWDLPIAIEVKGVGKGYRRGAGVLIANGDIAGRQLYCTQSVGDLFFCDGRKESNLYRFRGLKVGDMVHIDNHAFLAFCYSYRHHISNDPMNDFLRVDGEPLYPQHGLPMQSPLMGVPYSGQYEGKLLWIHHTHDASLWPPQGVIYKRAVEEVQGPEKARERFRIQWTQNAEHVPPMLLPSNPKRATTTWLINYMPSIEQGLVDLAAWVEKGVAPAETQYVFADGKVRLPPTAKERGGTQPVVNVTVGGALRAQARPGEAVTVQVKAEAPPGAGTFTQVHWDFDGSGSFATSQSIEPGQSELTLSTSHTYVEPGTYFATARVRLNREGDPAGRRQIENLASARIVVG